jgi:hypothetical protein
VEDEGAGVAEGIRDSRVDARGGQRWCRNKVSLHGPTLTRGYPSSTVLWGRFPTVPQAADEWLPLLT